MIHRDGVVVAVLPDSDEVVVEIPQRASACGRCDSRGGCHGGLSDSGTARRYQLRNHIGAAVGEQVSLVVADGTILSATWFSYLVPVLLALAGAAVGDAVSGDVGAIVGATAGLVGAVAVLRKMGARHDGSVEFLAVQRRAAGGCNVAEVR